MRSIYPFLAIILISAIAAATPYVPPDQILTHVGIDRFTPPQLDATFNHMVEFVQIAGFEQPLQCEDPGSNFGGEREEEPGGLYYIIETDNTLEAIQVWSRYRQLTSDTQYDDEIRDAWIYAYAWPAWLEGAGYYSAHNCAWALAAERQYRATFGDSSHGDYAVNSANYILQNPLPLNTSLNVMVEGWCDGNLYLYGEATNNENYKRVACQRALQIMAWVEADPQNRLNLEAWAMSSGTFIWGLCNSIFREDPALGQQWLTTYGPMVQVFEPTTVGWTNAWNVAYTNAQGGMYDVTGSAIYGNNHLALTNYLLKQDMDNDGGIPASASGSQNADASWTTCYLALMGCNRYLGNTADAGVLIITSPRTMNGYPAGLAMPVTALLGNWGTQNLANVMVTASGAYQDTLFVNLPALQNVSVNFGNWTPVVPGVDSIWVTVRAVGDSNAYNDADTSRFRIRPSAALAGLEANGNPVQPELPSLRIDSQNGSVEFSLPTPSVIELSVYNISGQRVAELSPGEFGAGSHSMPLIMGELASGIYLLRMQSSSIALIEKFAVVR